MTSRLLSFLFLGFSMATVVSTLYLIPYDFHAYVKPGIMGVLLIWAFIERKAIQGVVWLIPSMALSLAGDVLLMLPGEGYFIPGLLSFLLAHIAYIILNIKVGEGGLEIPFLRRNPWMIFLTIAYSGWVYMQLKAGAGEIAWAVLIYILVISLMWLTAWQRHGKVSESSFRWVVIGAGFFLISDSLLAWNRFVEPWEYSHPCVLATYAFAQYALFRGYRSV